MENGGKRGKMSLPELEVKCWRCWGNGVVASDDHADMMQCPACGGFGSILTEDGARLLEFVQRRLSLGEYDEEEEEGAE